MLAVWIAYIVVVIGLIIGWVMNVIQIVNTLSDPITGMFVFRCVGIIVAPLGGVLGWL